MYGLKKYLFPQTTNHVLFIFKDETNTNTGWKNYVWTKIYSLDFPTKSAINDVLSES